MSSWIPRFKLYDSTGLNLLYTFPYVQSTNHPHSVRDIVEHQNQRGKGSIIIDGGENPWDLVLSFILDGVDYEEVDGKINTLESTIEVNTPYVIKIDKTPSSYYEYKVKRIVAFEYPESYRNKKQFVVGTFRVNCW